MTCWPISAPIQTAWTAAWERAGGRPRRSVHQGSGPGPGAGRQPCGCAFVGRPLVEGTGGLRNFTVQARNAGCSLEAAYHLAAADLVERVLAFSLPPVERPKLLALHASSRATSNTLALWGLVQDPAGGTL